MRIEALRPYRVQAVNTDPDSENRIHSVEIARRYGFAEGLVPGVTVYGYMTVPVVRYYGRQWLEQGWMRLNLRKPFYEGEDVFVRLVAVDDDAVQVTAIGDGVVRVSAEAGIAAPPAEISAEIFPERPLPAERPAEVRPGELGTLHRDLRPDHERIVPLLHDPLEFYRAAAHPSRLLSLCNDLLMANFALPPWIHVSSALVNHGTARWDERVSVRGRVRECFSKKGHEFLVADVVVHGADDRLIQRVRHTAIWRIAENASNI